MDDGGGMLSALQRATANPRWMMKGKNVPIPESANFIKDPLVKQIGVGLPADHAQRIIRVRFRIVCLYDGR